MAMPTREEDAVRILTVADTHDTLFFFTNRGRVFAIKCHEVPPDSSRLAKGTAVVNLFPVAEGESVTAMVALADFSSGDYLLMATSGGEIKRTAVKNFASVRSSGLIAMDLEPGDEQVAACLATGKDDIILVTERGQSIRFNISELRTSSRTSGGVRGIRLGRDDRVVSMDIIKPDAFLLVVTTGGYGKVTPVTDYPKQHRAGGGVRTFKLVEKAGVVAGAQIVTKSQQVMIISARGIVTRTPVREKDPTKGITIQGRSTQGVRLMTLESGDEVASITAFE